ncbi:hypothetical protein [Modestobacter marinus]|uniref:hypothetical protein n=1 Tax=Modestobacter marinus TaxID=477641 RepID=UPI001C94917D|nr:hypothetical protein [Modestobacter marinus]
MDSGNNLGWLFMAAGTGSTVNVWDGTSWVSRPSKVRIGTDWMAKPVKRYTGSTWEPT